MPTPSSQASSLTAPVSSTNTGRRKHPSRGAKKKATNASSSRTRRTKKHQSQQDKEMDVICSALRNVGASCSLSPLTSSLDITHPGPNTFHGEEKQLWVAYGLLYNETIIHLAKGATAALRYLESKHLGGSWTRSAEGSSPLRSVSAVFPTGKEIEHKIGRGNTIWNDMGEKIEIVRYPQSKVQSMNWRYGPQQNEALASLVSIVSPEARAQAKDEVENVTFYFIARVDAGGEYGTADALFSMSLYDLKRLESSRPTTQITQRFKEQFRKVTKIPFDAADMVIGQEILKGALKGHVLGEVSFDTKEDAREHQSKFDSNGLLRDGGEEWVSGKALLTQGVYLLKEDGVDVCNADKSIRQFTSSRNLIEFMNGGGVNSKARKAFNTWLEAHNLHLTNTQRRKNTFVNPKQMQKDVQYVKKGKAYTINGLLVEL